MITPHPSFATLPRPLAFVLSAGAALGGQQVGMLRALAEAGLRPDFFVGSSVGALNGAFVAQSFGESRVAALERVWRQLRFEDVFGYLGGLAPLRLALGRRSLVWNRALAALIRKHAPAQHNALATPFHAVAADLQSGETRVLSDGDLHRHLLASAAIPLVFPPVEIEGRLFVDGAATAMVPIGAAQGLGAASYFVLDVGFPCGRPYPPDNLLEYAVHVATVALRSQTAGLLEHLQQEAPVLYLPGLCPLRVLPHDFGAARRLIDPAYDQTRVFLERTQITGPGLYGGPHRHDAR